MAELTCEFHPQRTAVEKCELCNRLICLADKNTTSISGKFSSGFNSRTSNQVVCTLCLYDLTKKNQNSFVRNSSTFGFGIIVLIIVFFGGFLGLINLITDMDLSFLNYFFGTFILISVVIVFLVFNVFGKNWNRNDKNLEAVKIKRDQLLASIEGTEPVTKKKLGDKTSKQVLYCYSCGSHLDPDAIFCPDCGDPTDKERRDAGLTEK